jgi:hypothetical protein
VLDGAKAPDYKQGAIFRGIPHELAFTSQGDENVSSEQETGTSTCCSLLTP